MGASEVVQLLLEHDAPVDAQDAKTGRTAAHAAAKAGHLQVTTGTTPPPAPPPPTGLRTHTPAAHTSVAYAAPTCLCATGGSPSPGAWRLPRAARPHRARCSRGRT
jgi:hypothetical protein